MVCEKRRTWIWYPGDFELWLRIQVEKKRQLRGLTHPPIWKLDSFYHNVKFRKRVRLETAEEVSVYIEGEGYAKVDGRYVYKDWNKFIIPQGEHEIIVFVINQVAVPALFVQGDTIYSDGSWEVSYYNGDWKNAAFGNLNDPLQRPSDFQLPLTKIFPNTIESKNDFLLVDFGKETFGLAKLENVTGKGNVILYYGESKEEAMSDQNAETFDEIYIDSAEPSVVTLQKTRAFRYIKIVADSGVQISKVSMLYEYLPVEYRGKFKSSDETLNKIWDTAVYTLHLNTREFYLDGIKRDRWVWGGDALQSFLMNYYIFFEQDVVRRTILALRGKDPVDIHINTIMDYTFYWFMSVYDYYFYTGDLAFIKRIYDQIMTLMEFCLKRRNGNGMMEGLPGDWVFIDWAEMAKEGELSSEQILLWRSFEIMAVFSQLLNDATNAIKYKSLAQDLKQKIMKLFWDDEQGGFITNRAEGIINKSITKHPSLLAIFTGLLDKKQIEQVKQKVILNGDVPAITTPYFRFFELDALCELGAHEHVTQELLSYWGGMLKLGATTFWEEYKPDLKGSEHYAMYGRPFGKSLCHAWGASPIYLLGKHYLGVKPLTAGYETYVVEPHLGGLDWIEGTVPIQDGAIDIFMNLSMIKVVSSRGKGYLRFKSHAKPIASSGEIKNIGENDFELEIETNLEYVIKYFL